MIIFNTHKKALHYVKFCKKTRDYSNDGYDWSEQRTFIDSDLVKVRCAGDSCGCGCDSYLYTYTTVIGRIKKFDAKSIRDHKINDLGLK